jgi:hypothetical protein
MEEEVGTNVGFMLSVSTCELCLLYRISEGFSMLIKCRDLTENSHELFHYTCWMFGKDRMCVVSFRDINSVWERGSSGDMAIDE